MNENLVKGEKVLLSIAGHNGFFYPVTKEASVLYDVECFSPPWVGGGRDRLPVILPESAISFAGRHEKKVVVWKKRRFN